MIDSLIHATQQVRCQTTIEFNHCFLSRGSYRGGSLARFTDEKNNEPRITDIEISFSRITKISTLLSCPYATIVFEEIKID